MARLLSRAGRLVMRAGKFVYTTCAACCRKTKPVIGYWKAIPCEQPIYPDICHPDENPPRPIRPGPIYLIDTIACHGRPIRAGDVVRVGGICYTVQDPHLPELPPGVTLVITEAECKINCYDDGCVNYGQRSGFGKADPCHPSFDPNAPVYYFCRRDVPHCVYVRFADDCYKLDPLTPPFFPRPGDVRIFPTQPFYSSCCQCFPGCSPCQIYDEHCTPNTGYTQVNFRDCDCVDPPGDIEACSMVVTGRFDIWTPDNDGGLYSHYIEEITYNGPCGPGARTGSAHIRQYERGVLVIDRVDVASITSSFDRCFGSADGFGFLGNPPCPPVDPNADPPSTLFWSNERTCTSVSFSLRNGILGLHGARIEVQVTRNGLVGANGCFGACGGQMDSAQLATPASPAVFGLLRG